MVLRCMESLNAISQLTYMLHERYAGPCYVIHPKLPVNNSRVFVPWPRISAEYRRDAALTVRVFILRALNLTRRPGPCLSSCLFVIVRDSWFAMCAPGNAVRPADWERWTLLARIHQQRRRFPNCAGAYGSGGLYLAAPRRVVLNSLGKCDQLARVPASSVRPPSGRAPNDGDSSTFCLS